MTTTRPTAALEYMAEKKRRPSLSVSTGVYAWVSCDILDWGETAHLPRDDLAAPSLELRPCLTSIAAASALSYVKVLTFRSSSGGIPESLRALAAHQGVDLIHNVLKVAIPI